jgi:cytochrome c biogenesis protein CcdA
MAQEITTLNDLKNELVSNPELQSKFKQDPVNAIQQIQQNPLSTDKWIYRIIVLSLGITIIFVIIGVIVLIAMDKISGDQQVPTILTAIGSAAIGALAGLLAPPPKGS